MSEISLAIVEPDENTSLVPASYVDVVRAHAEHIRTMLLAVNELDEPDHTLHIYRALYHVDGETVSAKIERARNPGAPGIPLLNAQILRRFTSDGGKAAQAISSAIGLQAEEIAVFLGLDRVDPAQIAWNEQTIRAHIGTVSAIQESGA